MGNQLRPTFNENGSVNVPAFELPPSELSSPEAQAMQAQRGDGALLYLSAAPSGSPRRTPGNREFLPGAPSLASHPFGCRDT